MAVETKTLKALYFQKVQAVESQALSTQGQPDVNLHRLTGGREAAALGELKHKRVLAELRLRHRLRVVRGTQSQKTKQKGFKLKGTVMMS